MGKGSSELRQLLDEGKRVIITIVHKFQFILNDISDAYKHKKFAIIIDEAHSSQNGSLSAKMNIVLSGNVYNDDDELEDKINSLIEESAWRKMQLLCLYCNARKTRRLKCSAKQ